MKDMLAAYGDRWEFTRGETLAVLHNLRDDQLLFTPPGDTWKPLYWQFTCAGRTQLVYAHAIATGKMDFALFASNDLPSKEAFTTKAAVLDFLAYTEKHWQAAIKLHKGHADAPITWGNHDIPLALHISGLLEHERMHLGQLISYHTLAGYELPTSFKENWSL